MHYRTCVIHFMLGRHNHPTVQRRWGHLHYSIQSPDSCAQKVEVRLLTWIRAQHACIDALAYCIMHAASLSVLTPCRCTFKVWSNAGMHTVPAAPMAPLPYCCRQHGDPGIPDTSYKHLRFMIVCFHLHIYGCFYPPAADPPWHAHKHPARLEQLVGPARPSIVFL